MDHRERDRGLGAMIAAASIVATVVGLVVIASYFWPQ